jgi:uncharacterized membrane protein
VTRSAGRTAERGAVALIVACSSLALVLVAALCVDLGMQRVVRSDMQSVADVAALDMARLLNTVDPGSQSWKDALQAELDRNDRTLGRRPAATPGADWVCTSKLCAHAVPGWVSSDNVFTTTPPALGAAFDGVKVETSAVVDFAFTTGSGGATRPAVARIKPPTLCFSAGTTTLALDTTKSALSPLLTYLLQVKLSAVGYAGLVDAQHVQVPLAGLLIGLGIGSVEQLAYTRVSLDQLTAASVDAIRAADSAADVSALDELEFGASAPTVALGDFLDVTTDGPSAGLTGDVNALDLLTAAVFAANSANALAAEFDVLGTGTVKATIIEPPRIACGAPTDVPRPTAETAQIRLHVAAAIGPPLPSGVTGGSIDLNVQVGYGEATLTELGCSPGSATFDVTTGVGRLLEPDPPGSGQVRLTITLDKLMSYIPGLGYFLKLALYALGVGSVGLDVHVGAEAVSSQVPGLVVPFPPEAGLPATMTVTGAASTLDLTGLDRPHLAGGQSGAVAALLGDLLDPTLDAVLGGVVRPVVDGAVDPLLTGILSPALSALGLALGSTDVNVLSRPSCSLVRLAG